MLNLNSVTTTREALEDRALALAVASPNVDPADIMVARESAAERLEAYLAHVERETADTVAHDLAMLHYAARNVEATFYAGRRVS